MIADLWTRPDPANPRKRVPTSRHGRGLRWAARWTDPAGRERSKSFATKDAAVAFLAQQRVDMRAGTYRAPDAGRATVGHYAQRWLATKSSLEPATRHWYRVGLDEHVLPRWRDVPVRQVTRAAVTEWVADLQAGRGPDDARRPLSGSRVRGMFVILRGILDHAVDDMALPGNPAVGVRLPPARRAPVVPLESAELARLHDALPAGRYRGREQHHRLVLLVLAFSGMRWGEMVALNVGDLTGRRIVVDDAVTTVNGRMTPGPTKTHATRQVVLPAAVVARLTPLTTGRPAGDPLIPAPMGGRWSVTTWRRALLKACESAGLPRTKTHTLRHTAASLAIAAGADVKVLQHMLGHAQGSMTIDTYGHLMADRLDTVADALEGAVPVPPLVPADAEQPAAKVRRRLRAV